MNDRLARGLPHGTDVTYSNQGKGINMETEEQKTNAMMGVFHAVNIALHDADRAAMVLLTGSAEGGVVDLTQVSGDTRTSYGAMVSVRDSLIDASRVMTKLIYPEAAFPIGYVTASEGVQRASVKAMLREMSGEPDAVANVWPTPQDIADLAVKHMLDPTEDQTPDTARENTDAIRDDGRVITWHDAPHGRKADDRIMVITEWDRSKTTVLFAGEY